ncbi:hypothetical protein HNV12_19220 [Methanococcoides sp. SA1]|nr:hypothetical protein [Methanococcoides sp. SA1]
METEIILILLFVLLGYIYTSFCLQKIAIKTSTENTWMAWVPLLNILLMFRVAKLSLWYAIIFLIPYVNFLMAAYLWGEIAGRLNRSKWLGVLFLIPVLDLILPGYLAFTDTDVNRNGYDAEYADM